ncbi:hypothetical protein EJB05_29615, partial [Eragrostis curvula]
MEATRVATADEQEDARHLLWREIRESYEANIRRIQLASMDAIKKNTPRFPLLLSVDQVLKWALIAAGWMAVTLGIGSAVFVAIIRILSGKLVILESLAIAT